MYQYDEYDQQIIEQRSQEFRAQVARRLDGKLTEEEFKPLRLMNGLYLQLHAYMLRVAIPYGVLSSSQMRALGKIAEKYDRGFGHFTTRQNVQFNWLSLIDTPDILDELARVQMHAIQTSGNCIRNITSDPLAGVAADESVDPRPVCELLRQWSTFHPEFAYLPRKFKFAVTGAVNDRALIKAHDIGLQLRRDASNRVLVDVWVGGGQGRTPKIAQLLESSLSIDELMPYLEAVMRVYNQYGRRDNKYKARIKILVTELGLNDFKRRVQEEFEQLDPGVYGDVVALLADIESRFMLPGNPMVISQSESAIPPARKTAFESWLNNNVKAHKRKDQAIVMISLKPAGGIPGDLAGSQMCAVADLAEKYSSAEIRVTHRQNLLLPHVSRQALYGLWQELVVLNLAEDNIDMPSDIISCPGLDYCALATARSIPIAQSISTVLRGKEKKTDLSGVTVNISGCINACAHHHVASIGILGLDRNGSENYQITLGGRADENCKIGERVGPGVTGEEVPAAIERVIQVYIDKRSVNESFDQAYRRLGKTVFKEAVYD
ncbi:MAG: nitrite/sulfite reductase [Granulosicoccus sp.]|nr:nitrite/sulfite reductase [Granulosicoccus sp.]